MWRFDKVGGSLLELKSKKKRHTTWSKVITKNNPTLTLPLEDIRGGNYYVVGLKARHFGYVNVVWCFD